MDSGDKATNKAMAIAMKYALFQVFCIPTDDVVDPDSETPEPNSKINSTTSTATEITTLEQARNYKLNFGQHKGKTLGEIVDGDKNYANWLWEKGDNTIKKCLQLISANIRQEEQNSEQRDYSIGDGYDEYK